MAKGPLLTPAGFAILRAPVLPASEAVQPEQHGRGIDDALFRAALRVASPGLAARLNAVSAKEAAPDLRRKANWYQRRMALRPTPFGLFAGVWVDRLRRRPIMIAADLGRAALLGSIPLAALLGVLNLAQLYMVAALSAMS